jgi:hypothetical protein
MMIDADTRSGPRRLPRALTVALLAAAAALLAALLPATAPAATNNIFTVAGTTNGLSGDTGPATAAQLSIPVGVAPTADGGYLIADQGNDRIRRVSPAGTITTVAGTTFGLSGDDGPATAAQLSGPAGVAPTADGGYLIADRFNDRIRRVSPAGTITTVAGTTGGLSGDTGPATAAQLDSPSGVAPTADGGYLIADQLNDRIRRVDAAGVITTVAGTTSGLSGDTGPATAAQLNTPSGVAATADGGFLIADRDNHRIRRVSPAGVITTVAGTSIGLSGDGGPATAAQLDFPFGVAATADGGFLIAGQGTHRIRRVSPPPDSRITTVAGTSTGLSGDGGPATAAQLSSPTGVAPTADGGFLIADRLNDRIRYVDADLRSPKGDTGDTGDTGAQGATGPPGASGAPGPAGADRDLLAAAIAADKTTTKNKQVRIRVVTTLAGAATLEAKPKTGKKAKGRAAAKAKTRTTTKQLGGEGRHKIKLARLKRGTTYKLTLSVTSADGQQATDSAKLKVKRKN